MTDSFAMHQRFSFPLFLLLAGCAAPPVGAANDQVDWRVTGGDPANSRYSPLAQINRDNVHELEVAWVYHTGDAGERTQMQATPIIVDGVLYTTSPMLDVIALRADTGEELWRFDPTGGKGQPGGANRGVTYWEDGEERRIFVAANRRLYALDARSGRPIPTFGDSGWVDLAAGLGVDRDEPDPHENPYGSGSLIATSPGVIYRDLLIIGSRVSEGEGALPGHIRAFDARTGEVRWVFRTVPEAGAYGRDTWPEAEPSYRRGGANSWAGMTVDVERGIVYAPTGSASPDFWGGGRRGANLFANSLLALDAATGERLWHFQAVHHDLWDRDLPAAPNLLRVARDGAQVDAVAQISKQGFVFLFDRVTGEPLFPIEERPVPPSPLAGEEAWPTQPFPLKPAPFARQGMTEEDLTRRTPEAHGAVLARFRTLRRPATLFTPPSVEGTIILPGFDGGGEWGGAAVDPERGILYVNASDVPWIAAMEPVGRPPGASVPRTGGEVYTAFCAGCHGADRQGDGDRTPSLQDVAERLSVGEIRGVIHDGRGFMPSFGNLPEAEIRAVIAYLRGDSADAVVAEAVEGESPRQARRQQSPSPYRFRGYERWQDPDGLPAIRPPWGTLSAIDLNTGEYLWRIPLGEHPAVTDPAVQPTGTEQYGGPIAIAGGLLFIAATLDEKFRAVDRETGEILWETTLPAAGYATPATYMVNGRQYVVVAAGGGKLGTKSGDAYVAFALPR